MAHERPDLRGEDQQPAGARVVQRLLAEAVAGQDQTALGGLPVTEGEHAVEP
jgi:hypothetical protein